MQGIIKHIGRLLMCPDICGIFQKVQLNEFLHHIISNSFKQNPCGLTLFMCACFLKNTKPEKQIGSKRFGMEASQIYTESSPKSILLTFIYSKKRNSQVLGSKTGLNQTVERSDCLKEKPRLNRRKHRYFI